METKNFEQALPRILKRIGLKENCLVDRYTTKDI